MIAAYIIAFLRSLLLFLLLQPLRESISLSTSSTFLDRYQRLSVERINLQPGSVMMTMMSSRPIWTPLDPRTFQNAIRSSSSSSSDGRRYAKDETYLQAVVSSWKRYWEGREEDYDVETTPWLYYDEDQTPLYGHIVRRTPTRVQSKNVNSTTAEKTDTLVPGVLLFHTAAGPHDVFLFQAAARLVSSFDCVALICDILSDRDGWAWTDRPRYLQVRDDLSKDDHRLLRSRVLAAILALCPTHRQRGDNLGVDSHRLAALGWCLGGQPILELTRMTKTASHGSLESSPDCHVRALISFHGVYHRDDLMPSPHEECHQSYTSSGTRQPEVLVCNGQADPFVSSDDLATTKMMITEKGYKVTIIQYNGAKHGFSNPAQAYNENDAFDYNEAAATASWTSTMRLLERQLLV
jgi:dienelactone hydrolase